MSTIATTEPLELSAGDRWQWRREDLSDYPASEWTLTYYFKAATGSFSVTAIPDGDVFAVDEATTKTAVLAAGTYDWTAYVSKTGDRRRVDNGQLVVLADMAGNGDVDLRSHAVKTLAAIEAVLEGRASRDQESYSINGRSLSRTSLPDLIALRRTYRAEVIAEKQAADRAAGRAASGILKIRFNA